MNLMRFAVRPTAVEDLQAASAVGQGKLYAVYDGLLRERGVLTAQVLLTFFDMSARTHYLNARQTLRRLLDLGVVPVINENDTTTTDEITFGDNDVLAAQVAMLHRRRPGSCCSPTPTASTRRPARRTPVRRSSRRSPTSSALGRAADRPRDLAAGLGRDALARSSRPRWPRRAGSRRVIAYGPARRRRWRRALDGEREGTRVPGAGAPLLVVQALAALRQVAARPRAGRRRRRARAARGRHVAAAGGRRGRSRARFDVGDAIEVAPTTAAWSGRASPHYTADELRQVKGLKSAEVRDLLPARDRGSRAPGLVRARCRTRRRRAWPLCAHACHESPTSASRRATPPASSRRWTPTRATPRCSRSPTRSSPAPARSSRPTPHDLVAGREAGLSDALLDRLALDPARIAAIADGARAIAALPDPVGRGRRRQAAAQRPATSARSASRSASSPSSTRRGRTSRSTPRRCA